MEGVQAPSGLWVLMVPGDPLLPGRLRAGREGRPLWNGGRQVPQLRPCVRGEPGGGLHATRKPVFSPDPPKSQTWGQQALGPQKQALTMWPANMVGVLCVFRPVVT